MAICTLFDILLVIKLPAAYIFQCVLRIISSVMEGVVSDAHETVHLLEVLVSALVL